MWEGMEITMFWEPVLFSVMFHQQELQEQSEQQNNIPVIKAAVSSPLDIESLASVRTIYNEASIYQALVIKSLSNCFYVVLSSK